MGFTVIIWVTRLGVTHNYYASDPRGYADPLCYVDSNDIDPGVIVVGGREKKGIEDTKTLLHLTRLSFILPSN